jgi:hypothetical protein
VPAASPYLGRGRRWDASDLLEELLEELRQTLPPIWLGTRTDELTGGAICWGTIQNRRAHGEAPEDAFVRAGNRIIVTRDKFLP